MLQVLYLFMLQGFSLILNGLFIKVNINVMTDLCSKDSFQVNFNTFWNPYVESLIGIETMANFSGSKFNTLVIPEQKNQA